MSSQICEGGFNLMKNSSRCKGKKRYMIPGKALKAVYNREAPLAAPCSVCPGGHQPFLQSLSCSGGESGPSSSGRARSLGIPLGFVAEGERVQACVGTGMYPKYSVGVLSLGCLEVLNPEPNHESEFRVFMVALCKDGLQGVGWSPSRVRSARLVRLSQA